MAHIGNAHVMRLLSSEGRGMSAQRDNRLGSHVAGATADHKPPTNTHAENKVASRDDTDAHTIRHRFWVPFFAVWVLFWSLAIRNKRSTYVYERARAHPGQNTSIYA